MPAWTAWKPRAASWAARRARSYRHRQRARQRRARSSRQWATARSTPSIHPCSAVETIEEVCRAAAGQDRHDRRGSSVTSAAGGALRNLRIAPRSGGVTTGWSRSAPLQAARPCWPSLLRDLPKDFPAAIVIVQHVDEQFAAGMATWLNQSTALPVRVAAEGDRPTVGEVLLAATNDHLTLKTVDHVGYTARADRLCIPSFGGCVFSKRLPAMARRDRRRAADRHGARRRARPEGAARSRPSTQLRRTRPQARSTACRRPPRRSMPRWTSCRPIASRRN